MYPSEFNSMIPKREFYFVRHGQTDHNLNDQKNKTDHPPDTPLNQRGNEQAAEIEPLVALLPIKTVCASWMRRAQETKTILMNRLQVPDYEIKDLGECTHEVREEMIQIGMYSPPPNEGSSSLFMERVRNGLYQALSFPGPCLIVAHGGVHWATCCLMNIQNHNWRLENCGVVHFSLDENERWVARKLT